jgi:hypothetical protein
MFRACVRIALWIALLTGCGASASPGADEAQAPPGGKAAPRLGLAGGVILPVSNGYKDQARLAAFRLYLRREWDRAFLEMGIPFAGLAWSGTLGSSDARAQAYDWTIYDLFLARNIVPGPRSAHVGFGLGLHRLHFTEDQRAVSWKNASMECGECGSGADGLVLTGEIGVGSRLVHGPKGDLTLTMRFRGMLIPLDAEDEARAQGILFQLGAIF